MQQTLTARYSNIYSLRKQRPRTTCACEYAGGCRCAKEANEVMRRNGVAYKVCESCKVYH